MTFSYGEKNKEWRRRLFFASSVAFPTDGRPPTSSTSIKKYPIGQKVDLITFQVLFREGFPFPNAFCGLFFRCIIEINPTGLWNVENSRVVCWNHHNYCSCQAQGRPINHWLFSFGVEHRVKFSKGRGGSNIILQFTSTTLWCWPLSSKLSPSSRADISVLSLRTTQEHLRTSEKMLSGLQKGKQRRKARDFTHILEWEEKKLSLPPNSACAVVSSYLCFYFWRWYILYRFCGSSWTHGNFEEL